MASVKVTLRGKASDIKAIINILNELRPKRIKWEYDKRCKKYVVKFEVRL